MPSPDPNPITSYWSGWENIEKLFVFGASYTGTGFNWIQNPQPSPELPLGNTRRGTTSSNGPNYISYLTTTFNASALQTYNFAFAGAQVDHLATDTGPGPDEPGNDMRQQVTNGFLPTYTDKIRQPYTEWETSSSLFISFFGINDILSYYRRQDAESVAARIMDAYATHLSTLYDQGARNFLLFNVPPLDSAPYFNTGETRSGHNDTRTTPAQRRLHRDTVRTVVQDFNARIPSSLIPSFEATYPDAKVFWYDTHALFTTLQSDPEILDACIAEYELP
ncbi:MAG: hypothetical protein Q9216_005407, partial [Gyalolechia sp. 2 TL-2023]